MSADDNATGNPSAGEIDEQRRRILKLTLGGGAAFVTPLMVSFSLEGLTAGGEALAQIYTYSGNQCELVDDATAALDDEGNLLVTLTVEGCTEATLLTVTADVTVVYGCRNRDGVFPPGQREAVVDEMVSTSLEVVSDDPITKAFILKLEPPALPEDQQACPPGLQSAIKEVTYEEITVEVGASDMTLASPSRLSASF